MKIPEFQSDQLRQQSSDAAATIGSRRETVRDIGSDATTYPHSGGAGPRDERVPAVDAVEFSPLSLTIIGTANADARVKSLESVFQRGEYSANAEKLAHTLVQTFLVEHDSLEARPETPSPSNSGSFPKQ